MELLLLSLYGFCAGFLTRRLVDSDRPRLGLAVFSLLFLLAALYLLLPLWYNFYSLE